MLIGPTSLIALLIAILSIALMIAAISLTAVPSVLHVVVLRHRVCECPGEVISICLYQKKNM